MAYGSIIQAQGMDEMGERYEAMSVQIPKENPCPCCERNIAATTCTTDEMDTKPRPGDLSVCAYCYVYLRYKDNMQLEWLRGAEWEALPEDVKAGMRRAQAIVRTVAEQRTTPPPLK